MKHIWGGCGSLRSFLKALITMIYILCSRFLLFKAHILFIQTSQKKWEAFVLRYIWIEAFFYPCIFKCYLFWGKEVILGYTWKQHTTKSIAQALNKPQEMCLGSYINSNNTPFTICLPSVRTDGWPLTNPMPQNCVFQYLMNERLRLSFISQLLLNYGDDAERVSFRLWNTFLHILIVLLAA